MLSKEVTERLLVRAKQGEESAKDQLITANSPLIKSIIRRYIGRGTEYDDLYQLGALGFLKAIQKYDATYGVKFTTYAVPLIAGEVKRFLRDDGSIKVSRSTKTLYTNIKKYIATRMGDENPPTVEEIASALDVAREDIIYAMEAAQMPISLFEKPESSGGEGEGLAPVDKLIQIDKVTVDDKLFLKNLLSQLELRERKVMIMRYFRNQTQSQIALALGISQVRVSRIEQRVLTKWKELGNENIA